MSITKSKPSYVVMMRYVVDVPIVVGGEYDGVSGADENGDPVTLTNEHEARTLALRIAQQTHPGDVIESAYFRKREPLYSEPQLVSVERL